MPRIKPKPSGLEVVGAFLTGDRGVENRRYREQADRQAQRDELDAQQAERERERHQVEIERVKRKQAEDEAARLRKEQEDAAAREATRWGIDRMQKEAAAQQGGSGPQTDPETRALLDRAASIADKLSPAAQQTFLGEVQEMATTAKLARAKDQAANRLANTIKDLSTSEVDAGPIIEQLTAAGEALQVAETPAQVAQAIQVIGQATAQAKQAIVGEHVKADKRAATIQSIQELYAGDPAKAGQAAALTRAVQFGVMEPDKALEMAVKDKYGLKPPSPAEVAAKGGPLEALYTSQPGRQAAAWMMGEARTRALKLLPQVLGPEATTEQRTAKLGELMERELELVRSENGWFPAAQQGAGPGPQSPAKFQAFEPEPAALYHTSKRPNDPAAGPKVPLEQVRESMGSESQGRIMSAEATAPGVPSAYDSARDGARRGVALEDTPAARKRGQDDPEQTKAAVAQEMVKRAKERGWTKEQARAEYEKALADMGLGGGG